MLSWYTAMRLYVKVCMRTVSASMLNVSCIDLLHLSHGSPPLAAACEHITLHVSSISRVEILSGIIFI